MSVSAACYVCLTGMSHTAPPFSGNKHCLTALNLECWLVMAGIGPIQALFLSIGTRPSLLLTIKQLEGSTAGGQRCVNCVQVSQS